VTHPGPDAPQPPPQQPQEQPQPYPSYGAQQPIPQPTQPQLRPGPFPSGYPIGGPPPVAGGPARSSTPGWVWPLVAVAALVTGLLGGVLGGALVLGTSTDGELLPLGGSAEPLDADNRSITAVAAKVLPSTVQVRVVNGKGAKTTGATGSGFVIDRRGHVITNNHVVAVAEADALIEVVDPDGTAFRAEVVGSSPVYDIAVLEVDDSEKLRPVPLGSSQQLRVGETVVAIGSPLGLSATVTSGIVSALDRPVTTGPSGPEASDPSSFINAVQTDAAINPGNSGGPLVNLRGQVVGVNSAIATTGGMFGGEGGNIGVGFAIPMDQVRFTAKQILETGKAEYPVIGANVNTADSSDGAVLSEVPTGGPASKAGLQAGDRIVAVDGKPVQDGVSLIVAIRTHRPGETIDLTILRDDEEQTVPVQLDAKVG
jgi:putative serine protease PepD